MKIYIDIGHGEGGDPGAVSNGLVEHEMNIVTGNAMAERLMQRGFDVKVEQGNLSMYENGRAANNWGADLLISQHYNAGGGDRGEVIYAWEEGSKELAEAVAAGLKNAGQTAVRVYKSKPNSRGTAEYFGVLRNSRMPAVIIEPCFIDNEQDRQLADTVEEQKIIGRCVAEAIAQAYGKGDEMDNKPDAYAKEAIDWAVENKLLHGNSEGNYKLHSPITRQNMLVFLYRLYKLLRRG